MQKVKYTLAEYENGGKIEAYSSVDTTANDYAKKYAFCEHFAKQGKKTVMTPKIHFKDPLYIEIYRELIGTKYERKCPDFMIGEIFYEHEGFDLNMNSDPKRTFGNMISRGMKQSDRIVIDDCHIGKVWAKRNLYDRVNNGDCIKEVWVINNQCEIERLL